MPKDHYISLSRQYRPSCFNEVIGQNKYVTILQNAIKMDRVSHAYLFSGIRGSGKTTIARLFAKTLNCHERTKECEPCNKCTACKSIQTGTCLDVIEVDAASNRGIDDIRTIQETLSYTTHGETFLVYIIDEVHMLTKEAFNALLKVLEEPPSHVKFLFATTEIHKVPLTILSRCQQFVLSPLANQEIAQKLAMILTEQSINYNDNALLTIANKAQGSMRDAESILDQLLCMNTKTIDVKCVQEFLGIFDQDMLFSLDKAFYEKNIAFAFELSAQFQKQHVDLSFFLQTLYKHYKNIISVLTSDACIKGYEQCKSIYSLEQVLKICQSIRNFIQKHAQSIYTTDQVELLLLEILQHAQTIAFTDLIAQIKELKPETNIRPDPKTQSPSMQDKDQEPILSTEPPRPAMDTKAPVNKSRDETVLQFSGVILDGYLKR